MAKRGRAYLDGGPANGMMVELDQPYWAPLGSLKVTVNGIVVTYVRARQRDPQPGQPWRYVPQSSVDYTDEDEDEDDSYQGENYDPNDD